MVVRPRILMYSRRTALRRKVLEGEPRERETYVGKAASLRLEMGSSGVDGEGGDEWGNLGSVGWGLRWYVESPHILTSLFRANENGCRVYRGKDRERGGSKKTRTRGGAHEVGEGREDRFP